ncbi:hypothetical protein J6R97_04940 [bacterium]|nr:hypothetical protein [bacterium]
MIESINRTQSHLSFYSKKKKEKDLEESHLMDDNLVSRLGQGTQKTMSAFIDYPYKGLTGDINSNFYEFLTMGIIPYLTGSAMFMLVFNVLNLGKCLGARDAKSSSTMGKKMALGVIMYGLFKTLSKELITKPIKHATGVNIDMPYQNKLYKLPKGIGEASDIEVQWQQRTVFDSKEFFRKDLLDREYYDNVAKKLGLGENLNDSISETTPIIQNIVATSNTAKSISSYCWAAVGVGFAMQKAWDNFFDKVSGRKHYIASKNETFFNKLKGKGKVFAENSLKLTKELVKTSLSASKQLWTGDVLDKGFAKHSGKGLIGFSSLVTIGLITNSIAKAKNMAKNNNLKSIDNTKESIEI